METLKGACIIGQSGGPTSVINASACGAIASALRSPFITRVLAAQNGIEGVLNDRLFDCGEEREEEISLLTNTPAAALGALATGVMPRSSYQVLAARSGTATTTAISTLAGKFIVWLPRSGWRNRWTDL